jgi:hypothetical protein
MINTKLQSIIDTKSAIGNAIVNKGGTITSETPFFNYAAQIDGISTGSVLTGNATTNQVFNGQTFYSNDANTQLTGTFVAPQIDGTDETKLFPLKSADTTSGTIKIMRITNNFVYVSDATNRNVRKLHESNLVFNLATANYGGFVYGLTVNDGFLYVGGEIGGGFSNGPVRKYHESNLVLNINSVNHGSLIQAIQANNNFLFVGGTSNGPNGAGSVIKKYHESNLVVNINSPIYGGTINELVINDSYVYAVGDNTTSPFTGFFIQKFHESNLTRVSNSANYNGQMYAAFINNGFIFVGGANTRQIRKYHESNLTLAANSATLSTDIYDISISNGYVYAGGLSSSKAVKFHESNLVTVGETSIIAGIEQVSVNNGVIYVATGTGTVSGHTTSAPFTNNLDNQSWYLLPKEE